MSTRRNVRENYGPVASSGGTTYSTLGKYSKGENYGAVPTSLSDPRMEKADPSKIKFVIPEYGGVGYNILQHGCASPDDAGYFNLSKAYP